MDAPLTSEEGKKILAIILNYNGGRGVLEAVHSLLRGTVVPDILVVDNASQDDSFETLKEKFPTLSFIQNGKNLGFAAGMNVGLRYGLERAYEFFWLLNNDATAEDGTLKNLLLAAREDQNALLSPAIYTSDGTPWFLGGKISFFRMRATHTLVSEEKSPDYLTGCALFLSRRIVEKIGFLESDYFLYYEDAAYSLAAKRMGYGLHIVPLARIIHSERSNLSPEKVYWLVRSGVHFFRKESPWYWRPWIEIFLFLRKVKNKSDLIFSPSKTAELVQKAYSDTNV